MTSIHLESLTRALHTPMLRFAQKMLHPADVAEDVVQDVLVALLESTESLQQAADPRRYVFGILRNKIADTLRRKYRPTVQHTVSMDEPDELDRLMFDENGKWQPQAALVSWNTPESHMQNDQFFAMVDVCVNHLSEKVARIFGMKAFLEFEADEICAALNISKTDYWQCMSRARKQLQLCLEQRWFKGTAA